MVKWVLLLALAAGPTGQPAYHPYPEDGKVKLFVSKPECEAAATHVDALFARVSTAFSQPVDTRCEEVGVEISPQVRELFTDGGWAAFQAAMARSQGDPLHE